MTKNFAHEKFRYLRIVALRWNTDTLDSSTTRSSAAEPVASVFENFQLRTVSWKS